MPLWVQLSQELRHAWLWFSAIPSFVFGALFSALVFFVQQQVSLYLARRKMDQLDFLDRINVSLNLLVDGKLKIRTLFERPLGEVIHNRHVREVLQTAALKASAGDNPVVRIPDAHSWFVLNCVLNSIAERFSDGAFREQRGLPVERAIYTFWVTCEPAAIRRERKIRVFLVEEALFLDFPFREKMPELESEKHRDRVHSLRRSYEVFRTDPQLFSRVEICT